MGTSGPVTLEDIALNTTDKTLEKLVKNMLRQSKAIGTVPWVTKNVLSLKNRKVKTLPDGQTRELNEGYSNVRGEVKEDTWEPRFNYA